MGEVPRRRGLLWKMEQALCPFLPIVSLLASAGLQMKKAIVVKRKERIIIFKSSYHSCHPKEQFEQGVILLDASGKTIDEILGELAIRRKYYLKPLTSCRRGPGHQGWGAPGHQAEGGHPSPVLPGSEIKNVDDQPLYPQTRSY